MACGSDGNVFGSTKKLGDAMVHSTRHCTSAAHSTHSTHSTPRQGTAAHRENAQGAQMRGAARWVRGGGRCLVVVLGEGCMYEGVWLRRGVVGMWIPLTEFFTLKEILTT